MTISDAEGAFVAAAAESISLSRMFTVTAGSSNPTYLVVSALDRNEYLAGSTGTTGSFTGNGHTLYFNSLGGDGRGAELIFTYQASTGLYYNSTYGYFNQLVYNSASSPYDVTNISVYGTNSLLTVMADSASTYTMMSNAAASYIGSATVVTEPKWKSAVPAQATPASIAAVAESFVGAAWNLNGCWTLASTIAAEAGASLPAQSTEADLAGKPNGEWIVAFNGPAGQSGNWQSMLTAGEMIVLVTASGTGHIATCVSGSGSTAELVDNVTYVNANGSVANLANDGSSQDVTISAPHLASQEFAGVSAASVVIYELDTPVIADDESSAAMRTGASLALGALFTASDPTVKTITEWQVYDTATGDNLSSGGETFADHTAAMALTVASLSGVSLVAGSAAATDTLEVRAYNGSYWGDWQSLSVTITMPASPPVLAQQTAGQSWAEGAEISLVLPASTFTDPQQEALTYTATQSNGQALPSWLGFNAATETFSGTAPSTTQSLTITVRATDTSGLSTADTFAASVVAPPPKYGIKVTDTTASQSWTDGQTVAFTLPANTFTDADSLKMTFAAYQVSGPSVTSWLHFNAATDELTGVMPKTATGTIGLEIIATDNLRYSATELFRVTLESATTHVAVATAAASISGLPPTPSGNPLLGLWHA